MPAGFSGCLAILGLAALAVPVCLPLLNSQEVSGGDTFVYIPRLVEFHENIRNGIWLPRWAPDLGHGDGQPLFLFVPPLVYYFGEFWHLLGFDFASALECVAVSTVIISAVSIFLLARVLFGSSGGWLAAAAYIYAPYFDVDLYVRRALGELLAFAFYPIAIYGLAKFVRSRNAGFLAFAVLGHAAVVLAHNGAALMFTPVLLTIAVFQAWQFKSMKFLWWQVAAVLLSLLLTAFIWLPSLAEMKYVHMDRTVTGYFDYRHHFVYPRQLVSSFWGWGGSTLGDQDEMSFSLGPSHVLLAVAALVLFQIRRHQERTLQLFLVGFVLVACYLTLQKSSSVLWAHLPLLPYIQFPWRFLTIAALGLALLIASLGAVVDRRQLAGKVWLLVALLLLITPNILHLMPPYYTDFNPAEWTPSELARRGKDTTASGEYEPRWVASAPPYRDEKLSFLSGDGKVLASSIQPVRWTTTVTSDTDVVVQAEQFYFPGWTARVDGRSSSIEIEPIGGRMRIPISKGTHSLQLTFESTTPRRLASALSLVALFGAIAAGGVLYRRSGLKV